ncbi:MAG: AbrB/MazE/SpoVT family DNA-binding domain-containing protein [Thermoleophilaceae bacterium]
MRTTIDAAGRLVVPKPLRDELGFAPGRELELNAVDGRLEVEVPATPMRLEEREGVLVAVPEAGTVPALDDETVRATLDRLRR